MTEGKDQKVVFDASFIFGIVRKYAKQLGIITGSTVLLSVVFSSEYFIKPKFKSTAIVYPSNLIPYSTESPTEQMIQLFGSDEIRDEIIDDFNLFEHYQIDTTSKYPLTTLHDMMRENINVDKTKFESVEITVWDTDPEIASAIADSIISKLHKKARTLQRTKSAEVVVILGNQLKSKKIEIDSMENRIIQLRKEHGILDFDEQIRSFSKVYYEEMANGRAGTNSGSAVDKVMDALGTKGTEFIALRDNLWAERRVYNQIKEQYDNVLKDLTKELTYSNLVTSPVPAEKKSYPVRSLIVLMATISSIMLSLIVIIFIENRQRIADNRSMTS